VFPVRGGPSAVYGGDKIRDDPNTTLPNTVLACNCLRSISGGTSHLCQWIELATATANQRTCLGYGCGGDGSDLNHYSRRQGHLRPLNTGFNYYEKREDSKPVFRVDTTAHHSVADSSQELKDNRNTCTAAVCDLFPLEEASEGGF
jgi:hypothetical protein